MRSMKPLLWIGLFVLLMSSLAACGHGTFTQTFIDQDDSTRTLTLTSNVGVGVHPASNFPANLMFKLFGTDKLEGTYVLLKGDNKEEGKFATGKTGEEAWIKFTRNNQEFTGKIIGRALIWPDNTVWTLSDSRADAKTAASIKIGE